MTRPAALGGTGITEQAVASEIIEDQNEAVIIYYLCTCPVVVEICITDFHVGLLVSLNRMSLVYSMMRGGCYVTGTLPGPLQTSWTIVSGSSVSTLLRSGQTRTRTPMV